MKEKLFSLRSRLYSSFLFIFIYLLIFTTFSFFINSSISTHFNNMLMRTGQFARLLVLETEVHKSFELCLRAPEKENIREYLTLNRNLDDLLIILENDTENTQETDTYLRVIRNMQNYQLKSSFELFGLENLSPEHYEEISYLSTLFKHMNQQVQELAVLEQSFNMDIYSTYYSKVSSWESLALIILGLIFLLFGVFIIYTLNGILTKTSNLITAANTFSEGKVIQKDFPLSDYKELNAISLAFNTMKKDINHYIEELKKKSELEIEYHREHLENEKKDKMLKQAQLDLLRSQINPHFLFNTLNIIGKSAVLNDTETSLELIESISLILRYTLEHFNELVSLKEEIKIVRSYLFIQKTRFSSRLSFNINVSDGLLNYQVPPMFIQPLVENCIKHGIETVGKSLDISITVSEEDNFLIICVRDNGPGFEMEEKYKKRKGIGMNNVKQRLELRYNNNASILYQFPNTGGTEVIIKLPVNGEYS